MYASCKLNSPKNRIFSSAVFVSHCLQVFIAYRSGIIIGTRFLSIVLCYCNHLSYNLPRNIGLNFWYFVYNFLNLLFLSDTDPYMNIYKITYIHINIVRIKSSRKNIILCCKISVLKKKNSVTTKRLLSTGTKSRHLHLHIKIVATTVSRLIVHNPFVSLYFVKQLFFTFSLFRRQHVVVHCERQFVLYHPVCVRSPRLYSAWF